MFGLENGTKTTFDGKATWPHGWYIERRGSKAHSRDGHFALLLLPVTTTIMLYTIATGIVYHGRCEHFTSLLYYQRHVYCILLYLSSPSLVVWGDDFQGNSLDCGFGRISPLLVLGPLRSRQLAVLKTSFNCFPLIPLCDGNVMTYQYESCHDDSWRWLRVMPRGRHRRSSSLDGGMMAAVVRAHSRVNCDPEHVSTQQR